MASPVFRGPLEFLHELCTNPAALDAKEQPSAEDTNDSSASGDLVLFFSDDFEMLLMA